MSSTKRFSSKLLPITVFVVAMLGFAASAWAVPVHSVNPYTGYADDDFLVAGDAVAYCGEEYALAYPDAVNSIEYEITATDASTYAQWTINESKDWRDGNNPWNNVRRVLYFGYPTNGANLQGSATDDAFRNATQRAVWYFTDSNTAQTELSQKIIDAVLDQTKTVPDSATLKFYATEKLNRMNTRWQSVFVLDVSAPKPRINNTTLKANDSSASESSEAKVTIEKGKSVELTDTVELYNLEKDKNYILSWKVVDKATKGTVAGGTGSQDVAGSSTSVTVSLGTFNPDSNITYTVVMELREKDNPDAETITHNGEMGMNSETAIITVNEPSEESSSSSSEASSSSSSEQSGNSSSEGGNGNSNNNTSSSEASSSSSSSDGYTPKLDDKKTPTAKSAPGTAKPSKGKTTAKTADDVTPLAVVGLAGLALASVALARSIRREEH